jgi:uncharacterized protein (DUF1810 family)
MTARWVTSQSLRIPPMDASLARMDDPHDLQRFVDAQATTYERARVELVAGEKQSHWMWFVFPQMKGLGMSAIAKRYGIASLDEAVAYFAHRVLGSRLVECTRLVLAIQGKTARRILGSPDDIKLRSSMTLFELAAPAERAFRDVLEKYYDRRRDLKTLELLGR